jgi:hypothetical protein
MNSKNRDVRVKGMELASIVTALGELKLAAAVNNGRVTRA